MGEGLEVLDKIDLNFSQNGLLALNITLAFIMFGVALDLKPTHFTQLLKKPKPLLVGVVSQFILLPAITFFLIQLLHLSTAVALGMLLVASCPGGNISNFVSHLAKGNTALSISLTAAATLLAIFMTPINFAFWGKLYAKSSPLLRPIEIDPLQMFQTVFILLGLPLIFGIFFSHKFPRLTQRILKPIKILSIVAFMGFVVIALANNFGYFLRYIHLIIILVLAHNAIALFTGYSAASIMGLSRPDRRSITIETGIQNSGLALVLMFNPKIFPAHLDIGGMAFIAAWWGVWHIISGLIIATIWSRKSLKN
ncbi:MAG: bile acid:sodium symporter family protein [Bacteroidales bacterium]